MLSYRFLISLVSHTYFILFLTFVSLFLSCNTKPKESIKTPDKIELKQSFKDKVAEKNVENYQLLEYACLYCHALQDAEDKTPTMKKITAIYKNAYPVKADFVNAFIAFTHEASKESILMKTNALDQCGFMQKDSELPLEDIEDIAGYLFDYKP